MWDIVGHQRQIQYLQKSIKNGKISQAYIFSGPAHLGKKSVAESFLFNLFCVSETEKRPCGRCKNCAQIKKNIHPDIYWLEPETDKKNISIKQIRGLIEKLNHKSLSAGYKVALIKQASALTLSAANALLKTLEEPAPKTVIILLVENLENIPSTILSRCQILRFLPVNSQKLYEYLATKTKNPAQALALARLSQGRPGQALNFLKKPKSIAQQQEQTKIVIDLLNNPDLVKKITLAEKLTRSKKLSSDLPELITSGLTYLRNALLAHHQLSQYATANVKTELTLKQIKNKIKLLETSDRLLRQNVQPKLILENMILNS